MKDFWKNKRLVRNTVATVIFWIASWTFMFWNRDLFFAPVDATDPVNWKTKWYMLCGIIVVVSCYQIFQLICIYRNGPKKREKKKIFPVLVPFMAAAQGALSIATLEFIFNEECGEIEKKYILLSITIAAVFCFIIFLLFNSLKWTVLFMNLLYFIWAMVEYYTQLFRGMPMQMNDILDAGTAMQVLDSYELTLTPMIVMFAVYIGCLIGAVWAGRDYCLVKEFPFRIGVRVCGVILLIWGIWFLGWGDTFDAWGVRLDGNIPLASFEEYGTELAFISGARNMIIEPPEGYSVERVKEAVDGIEPDSIDDSKQKPNIILIMNESFADISDLGEFETSEEVLPVYNSLNENTMKGRLMVSTYGGGTGKTEYEVLTGNSMSLYNNGISPYVMLGSRMEDSLASTLKEQGYTTAAMHPYMSRNYNRDKTYETMGFDTFYDINDFEDPQYIRGYIKDISCYEKIEEIMETKEEGVPMFTFCVTIQTHGAYTYEGLEPTITLPDFECPDAEQYLTLLHDSDQALGELIQYFENFDEPVIIGFFGDHYPNLPVEFYEHVTGMTDSELAEKDPQRYLSYYSTPYLIWANYDLEEEEIPVMSANYLGVNVLKHAGVSLTVYQKYLLELQEQVKGFSGLAWADQNGNYQNYAQIDAETREKIDEANSIQYNELLDRKHKMDSIFSLNPDKKQ